MVALQEVRSNLKELKEVLRILGPDWDYIATDVTDGQAGNGERMVFLYNINFVSFQNIAGELTLADNDKVKASFGEMLLLIAIHFHSNQNTAIADLVSGTLGMKVSSIHP